MKYLHRSELDPLVREIDLQSQDYQPSPEAAEVLGQTTFVPIIGPFAVGKTTLMNAVEQKDERFGRVVSFTTRPQRTGEYIGTYHFLPHNAPTLTKLQGLFGSSNLVEMVVHEQTSYVYGSDTSTYTKPYSMLDTLSSVAEHLSSLPFKEVKLIGLVAPPRDWWSRIAERQETAESRKQRCAEAITSLEWLLDHGDDISWVLNPNDGLEAATAELIAAAQGERTGTQYRMYGELLLGFINELKV